MRLPNYKGSPYFQTWFVIAVSRYWVPNNNPRQGNKSFLGRIGQAMVGSSVTCDNAPPHIQWGRISKIAWLDHYTIYGIYCHLLFEIMQGYNILL